VAAELSRRGWLATVTIKNAPGTDVLAQDVDTQRVVAIQTKTARAGFRFQLKGPKLITYPVEGTDEWVTHGNEWYVFVGLKDDETARPDFYVVPRNIVAGMIFASHREWLKGEGARRTRRDGPMRQLRPADLKDYQDRWDLLKDDASTASTSVTICS
jgi:hypothetical protein